jgi:phosphate-selective porin OprO and OprP
MKTTTGVLTVLAGATLIGNAADPAERLSDLEKRYEALEQKYKVLERKLELQQEAAGEKSKTSASLSAGASGFTFRSADTNFVFKLRGLLQVDSRTYVDDGGIGNNDTFAIRRARPIIEGTLFKYFDFLLTPEFGPSTPAIRDAYLNFRYIPELQLRAGKMKTPIGLELWQSSTANSFVERSLVSDLLPGRDVGFMLHGEVWQGAEADTRKLGFTGVLNYSLGAFNGVGDGRNSSNVDFDDEKSGVARLFLHPFLKTGIEPLKGLGLGIAGSYGNVEGGEGLPSNYQTEGLQSFFSYRSGANFVADGNLWRISPQGYYYWGPLGLMGEYVVSSQNVRATNTFANIHNRAWHVSASYVLTGEDNGFRGVTPRNNFDPREGHWGALQLVARYSQLELDDEIFPTFANPATAAERAAAWGVGVNWYLNRNVRASGNFIRTDFKGGEEGTVTAQDENVFLTRLQLAF